ncbi:class I SAM-dependent methyltransferase [Nitrosococcus oceani]|uniref:class I SAM-dependent methyltransferase n=1 Tax=Nitrosococcus oceani TaxID=1229 RepID=UPI0004E9489A|nr:class I SAM-dependent methyltransferase [Nitrosococcus oceani]KFI22192.1 SAM-dependent methlyltransferase [Nitrosococcus oceani]
MKFISDNNVTGINSNNLKGSYQKAHFDWLRLRYQLDAAARDQSLESQALTQLSKREQLRVLDLGAGAGANICYYARLLPSSTQWWMVERDSELLKRIPQFIIEFLGEKINTVHPLKDDFLAPDCPIYKTSFDLVVANAVFDLLSADQFQGLLQLFRQAWEEESPLFLFTLNLDRGIRFYPTDKETERWCRRYEFHMHRSQHFGRAMAAHCGGEMEKLFLENGFNVNSASSAWDILPLQEEALLAKLDFFEKAMAESISPRSQQWYLFQRWLRRKRYQARRRKLSLHVPHRDFLARIRT